MIDKQEKHWVFIGLGNPGTKYQMTRHNFGALLVAAYAEAHGFSLKENKSLLVKAAKGKIDDVTLHLVVPLTYMNESGQAVRKYIDYYRLTPENIIVIVDDVALPFGDLRLRNQGSSGGHNGLKSVSFHLGTNHYARLKLGIDRNTVFGDLSGYVLDNFSGAEIEQIPRVINEGIKSLDQLLTTPINDVMSGVNVKVKEKENLNE